ncbi:hypothetical protein [Dactylosporangium matsuzakiense]|uniref:Uncharacterized protein n=1 Tax=Dactylosporangium matsuzakiense TaxID=53360 RepID=A0A9W6NHY8_9ACTN|nr:hypothetical protein [Dactylosporangium matsuzakiense]UWZ47199.1 hypothetical protein Dmats_12780 [Dactylosporangium matsuzakiense]GLK98359.1 hypothetical protein GCM10017581_001000 [Dactylosporangium matsuzakiense]
MHTHVRSLWLSRRARWSASAVAALAVVLLVGGVVYRINQRPYGFKTFDRVGGVALPAGSERPRAFLDGGRAFLGRATGGGGYELRAVDSDRPATALWTNTGLTDVDTFRYARGMVQVTGLADARGGRRVTLLNANNGLAFRTFDVAAGDRWALIGKYFVRYADAERRLTVTDVGSGRLNANLDQPAGAASWWLIDNWSGQQVPTSPVGEPLDEALTVDPHIVRATADGGLEVVDLAGGRTLGGGKGLVNPDSLVYPYEEQVFTVARAAGFELRAYTREHFGKPQWTWASPDPSARPLFVSACGEERICVGEDHAVTALDTATGAVVFRVAAERPSQAIPVGDRIMLRTASVAEGVVETLLDAQGRTVDSWPGKRAARLDEGSYLLLPAVPAAGPFAWLGVDAQHGTARDLGSVDARPDSCTWSHTYLACATAGEFAFYRIRAPWYSL